MSATELYTKGAKVWLPDPIDVWKIGEILEDFKSNSLKIVLDNREKIELQIKEIKDLPPLGNPESLIGGNDLTSLSCLHEPAVLHTLKIRYKNLNAIYTYLGTILVAVNPYQELPIYSQDMVLAYRNRNQQDPHIFQVVEKAFTKMERENQDQSIIISGGSGAGKTVLVKHIMSYFATYSRSDSETQVGRSVLASSLIMEAIGHAKTTRNDNSSRFGKYIKLGFNSQYHIQGAGMRTYLLEKSRVVCQSAKERNYHIFYQLCAASSSPDMSYLQLQNQDHFHYTRQGGCPTIDGVDDLADLNKTRHALSLVGFTKDQQADMFRVLSAILHLGNVKIVEAGHERSIIASNDAYLTSFCSLMGLDAAANKKLCKRLCSRKIVTEDVTKPMTKAEASFARDALAKHLYSLLFQKIVTMINKSLAASSSSRAHRFIGVLDIYGFETFEWNSFEQFCINYANEKLQHQFNQHVFKLEQEEYTREMIEWTSIDFYNNQPCIDLIEKPSGILDLLDEECRVPKGTDQAWVQKLYDKCKKYPQLVKPRLSNTAFIIVHFAGDVKYQCKDFVKKNRNTVLEEQVQILRSSSNTIVKQLFSDDEPIVRGRSPSPQAAGPRSIVGTTPRGGSSLLVPGGVGGRTNTKQNRRTAGSQFRKSLTLLMETLDATSPHYVRCIKPNDSKESFVFDPSRAVQQLRACGVLETVRISAAGFPSRLTYEEFIVRYRVLFHSLQINRNQLRESCDGVLTTLITEEDQFKFGASKIFFRAGQVAYLEKRRTDKLRACGLLLQRVIRGWFHRKRYLTLRKAAISGQRFCRGYLARRKAQLLRETRSAIIIQKHVRGFIKRRQYTRLRETVLGLQTYGRGFLARKRYLQLVCNAKAVLIQKMVRGFLARRRYARARKSIVLLQCCWRRWLARRQYKALRVEARSIEHVKNRNKGLENKIIIISMQQEIVELKAQDEANRGLLIELNELELFVKELIVQLDRERDEKMNLIQEREKSEKLNEELNSKINNVQKKLLVSEEINQICSQEAEDSIKRRLDHERAILAHGYDQERAAHQKMLQDYRELEERTEEAKRELERLREKQRKSSIKTETVRGHSRNASNVSTLSNTSEPIPDPEDVIVQQDGLVIGSASFQESMQTSRDSERSETLPIVRKKDDLGMFEFNIGDEKQIARNLVHKLKPSVASTLLPGLPAYIILMCVRHAVKSEKKIRSFLTTVINEHLELIKERYEDLDTLVLWLVNTCRLLNLLNQYSGDESFQRDNTPKQNDQCLRNFDLSEYKRGFRDIRMEIYKALIKHMEERVQQLIVPAVLEHGAISGLSSHKQPVGQGGRARSGSTRDATSPVDPQEAFALLLRELTMYHQSLQQYGVDPPLVAQAFCQVFYYICAYALNKLLFRTCHRSKGIQIRNNILHLEQWLREQNFHGQDTSTSIIDTLQPIRQAAQLLEARKSVDDVVNICAMCSRLTSAQITKILNLYTPADELEDRILLTFIRKVEDELQKRTDPQSQGKLLMDTKFVFTLRLPFRPSSVKLEDIDVPAVLNLPMLRKL